MKMRIASVPSLWALALGAVFAQQTPPETTPEEEEELPAPNYPKIDVAYGSWGLSGNKSTFGRYGAPPRGFYFKEISFGLYEASPANFGEFRLMGQPFDDHILEVAAIWGADAATFEGWIDNTIFYQPSAHPIGESKRRQIYGVYRRPLGEKADLVLDYSGNQLDTEVEGPAFGKHQRTNRFSGRLAGAVGRGRAEVSMADRRYYDRANFQPDTRSETWRGELSQPLGQLNLTGAYAHTKIEQRPERQQSQELDPRRRSAVGIRPWTSIRVPQ